MPRVAARRRDARYVDDGQSSVHGDGERQRRQRRYGDAHLRRGGRLRADADGDGYSTRGDQRHRCRRRRDRSTSPSSRRRSTASPTVPDIFVEVDSMPCAQDGCPAGDSHGDASARWPAHSRISSRRSPRSTAPTPTPIRAASTCRPTIRLVARERRSFAFVGHRRRRLRWAEVRTPTRVIPATAGSAPRPTAQDANCANILAARRLVFHYGSSRHDLLASAGASGIGEFTATTSSSRSDRGRPTAISAAGGARADASRPRFMHELGHNLALRHGGPDGFNCKPNYLSVMNYSMTIVVPRPDASAGLLTTDVGDVE